MKNADIQSVKISKRGFTLIELVIVIGILAILATVVVLVLNPAQLLAQARDSQRISDLTSVKSAIALYMATANSPALTASTTCTVIATTCNGNSNPFAGGTITYTSSTDTGVLGAYGSGWVGGVKFADTAGGSALSALPLDPLNSVVGTDYYYAYRGDSSDNTFKLMGRLESLKYKDKMKTDGGTNPRASTPTPCSTYVEDSVSGVDGCYYEIGTKMSL